MRFLLAVIGVAALTLGAAHAADTSASSDPSQLVQGVAQTILKELDANRAAYRADPSKIDSLVEKDLLPHFDIDYAARLVLGAHWRAATAEQRERFVHAFYHSLIANYGNSITSFTADRLKVFPTKPGSDPNRATVRTEVKRDDGTTVPVLYSMRRADDGSWKAWDVVIDGISYVKSFHDDFGEEIDQKGLDEVITRMEKSPAPLPKH
jgi:phospholipid transport system substrate-binding protein